MHRCIEGHALVDTCCRKREEATLRGARHTEFLMVPGGILADIVDGSDTTENHVVVVVLLT